MGVLYASALVLLPAAACAALGIIADRQNSMRPSLEPTNAPAIEVTAHDPSRPTVVETQVYIVNNVTPMATPTT